MKGRYILIFLLIFTIACVQVPDTGKEGKRCFDDHTCLDGLKCNEKFICVRDMTDGGNDAAFIDEGVEDSFERDSTADDIRDIETEDINDTGWDDIKDVEIDIADIRDNELIDSEDIIQQDYMDIEDESIDISEDGDVDGYDEVISDVDGVEDTGDTSISEGCIATMVSTGDSHTCALMKDNTVRCWGNNSYGQLGTGDNKNSLVPVIVKDTSGSSPLTGVKSISAGRYHTCALMNDSSLVCWGANDSGQLGVGDKDDRNKPVKVQNSSGNADLTNVKSISAGDFYTCAVIKDNSLLCWGDNAYGQLGTGDKNLSELPVSVKRDSNYPLSDVDSVSAGGGKYCGAHTCAIKRDGSAMCWGSNSYGQLGNGVDFNDSLFPQQVKNINSASSISSGDCHTCAIQSHKIKCWGSNHPHKQLGTSSISGSSNTPVDIDDSSDFKGISCREEFSCAITSSGGVKCWGFNDDGQAGGTDKPASVHYVMDESYGVKSVSSGYYHACAVTVSGDVECWGKNDSGQFGNGTTNPSNAPVKAVLCPSQ